MTKAKSNLLLDMLRYKRPEGSKTQSFFCQKFLKPVFGPSDVDGNYMMTIGDNPRIAFMAHHDTVHNSDGMQTIYIENNIIQLSYISQKTSNCLGADCTTGIWLILHMIENNVPGRYIIHAGEERGGIGAKALMKNSKQYWIEETDFAISFDRYGTKSVITHQFDKRTASEEFAKSLSDILDMNHVADDGGSFTDSEIYSESIPECTNLSVGYVRHHTAHETQDLAYVTELADALVEADWSQLVIDRDPTVIEYSDWGNYYNDVSQTSIQYLVEDHPEGIASLLEDLGYSIDDVVDYLGLVSNKRRVA